MVPLTKLFCKRAMRMLASGPTQLQSCSLKLFPEASMLSEHAHGSISHSTHSTSCEKRLGSCPMPSNKAARLIATTNLCHYTRVS